MRDDITSIPISEIFETQDGCPICRMRDLLEQRMVDYITGAAMMEPDVRKETNKLGFCYTHYEQMLKKHNHLGVALMMESHLDSLEKRIFGGLIKDAGKQGKAAKEALSTCFVCERVDKNMEQMADNLCKLWERERDFRDTFAAQPTLCLPHYALLTEAAGRTMGKRYRGEFGEAASKLAHGELENLRADVKHFCSMFDYRNSGENADWGTSKDSVERCVHFFTSRHTK